MLGEVPSVVDELYSPVGALFGFDLLAVLGSEYGVVVGDDEELVARFQFGVASRHKEIFATAHHDDECFVREDNILEQIAVGEHVGSDLDLGSRRLDFFREIEVEVGEFLEFHGWCS